jgi:membrane-associated phospholipid phosphatase
VDGQPGAEASSVPPPSRFGDSAGRWWPLVAAGLLLLLTVIVVNHPEPLAGEIDYVLWLQRIGEPVPTIAEVVRATTGTEACVLLLFVAVSAAMWRVPGLRTSLVRAALIAMVVMLVVQPVFKELVDRPRPTATQVEVRADHASKSFPSGHSMSTTTTFGAAAAAAWFRKRRLLAGLAAIPIVLTGFASGVQGVHWPTDVLAGTLAGAVAAWLIVRTMRPGGVRLVPGDSADRSLRSFSFRMNPPQRLVAVRRSAHAPGTRCHGGSSGH